MISKESLMKKLMDYDGSVPLDDLYRILDDEIDVAPDRGSFVIAGDITYLHTDDWMEIWRNLRNPIPSWLRHSYGVAEKMYQMAKGKSEAYARDMWLLGLLHDIGKNFGKHQGHEKRGAAILTRNGFNAFADYVAAHSEVPTDVEEPLDLLLRCDMSVNQRGEDVGIDERLKDIGTRHKKWSKSYKASEEIANYLSSLDERLEENQLMEGLCTG